MKIFGATPQEIRSAAECYGFVPRFSKSGGVSLRQNPEVPMDLRTYTQHRNCVSFAGHAMFLQKLFEIRSGIVVKSSRFPTGLTAKNFREKVEEISWCWQG